MELGDGGDAAAAAAAGEDRLSELPNDVLVLILRKLTTRAAAQTSVLSHRWRRVWALLPALSFASPPEPHRLRDVLDSHEVLLGDLLVGADGATPESLAVWLPTAATRVSGDLTLKTYGPVERPGEEDAAKRGAFELPCFEQATTISFSLGFQGLAVPLTGVFARLTGLHLSRVWFHGPGELGDAVSTPRCPCLQRLTVEYARGLRDLAIHSESLLLMELKVVALSQLTVVAPVLNMLTVAACFLSSPPIADISAPLLTELDWDDEYDPSSVHLRMTNLQYLVAPDFYVYGKLGVFLHNQSCLSRMQHFEGIKSLFLTLVYPPDIENDICMMEDMEVLPGITFLRLMVIANGHGFEASAFHVLRLCTGIRRLMLDLVATEAQTSCCSNCKCGELVEWETEELLLNHLEEVEINGWRGTEHEVAFVERLFYWGTKLKEMTVNFCDSISGVKAKELYQIFQGFSRPGVCMKFYRYQTDSRVLYAPED